MKKVAIIGAGASGLLCAIECAKAGLAVDIYEQNSKAGKKILVSGNGRCNISNTSLHVENYFSQNPSFVAYALKNFPFEAFRKHILSLGLELHIVEDGRAYPLSNEAKSVVHILHKNALDYGTNFLFEQPIETLKTLQNTYDAIVIATGSEAAPQLGGTQLGYKLAQEIGHTIIPTYPALVQLELNSSIAPKMAGTKTVADVTLYINGIAEQIIKGDLLFTNYGVSGFAVLDISILAAQALQELQAVDIEVNLLPHFTRQKLASFIIQTLQQHPSRTIYDVLLGLLPTKIVRALLEYLHVDASTTHIDTKLSKKIANQILQWKFEVTQTHGFKHAEVSGGGVNTLEIDAKTFRSKKNPKVYIVGEVLDVVGKRGGYNFAFAWSSAYLAAKDIIKTNNATIKQKG